MVDRLLAYLGLFLALPPLSRSTSCIDTFSTISVPSDHVSWDFYAGGAAVGTRVYLAPSDIDKVGVIDVADSTYTTLSGPGGFLNTENKYRGGGAVVEGNVYFAPFDAAGIGVVDTTTNTFSTISTGLPVGWNSDAYRGTVAVGTRVFFAPSARDDVGVFDTRTNEFSTIATGVTGLDKYQGAGVARLGTRIFFAPHHADHIGVLEASTDIFSTIDVTGVIGTGKVDKYDSAVTVGTRIYFGPHDMDNVGVLDTTTDTFSTISTAGVIGTDKYRGAVVAGSRIFFAPRNQNKIGMLDTATDTFSTLAMDLSFLGAKKFDGAVAVGNKIVFTPDDAKAIGLLTVCERDSAVLRWKFTPTDINGAAGKIESSPALSPDGKTVFVTAKLQDSASRLYAVDVASKTLTWSFAPFDQGPVGFGYRMYESPAVSPDGTTVVVGCWDDRNLYALNANGGTLKWTFEGDDKFHSRPVFSSDSSTLYVGSYDKKLYAINVEDGTKKWEYTTEGRVYASPTLSPDGKVVYVGSDDSRLHAVIAVDGLRRWNPGFSTLDKVQATPAVTPDGTTLFVGSGNFARDDVGSDHNVYAINANTGTARWTFQTSAKVWSSPVLSRDAKTVFVGSTDFQIYAINVDDGSLKWAIQTGNKVWSSPALSPDGQTLYIGSDDYKLYAVNVDDGTVKWVYLTSGQVESSPIISSDGATAFVGSNDGSLYALWTSHKGRCGDKDGPVGGDTEPVSDADCGSGFMYDPSKSGHWCAGATCVAGTTDQSTCCKPEFQSCASGTAADIGRCTGTLMDAPGSPMCSFSTCLEVDYGDSNTGVTTGVCCQLKSITCTATQYVSNTGQSNADPTCAEKTLCCTDRSVEATGFSQGNWITAGNAGTCPDCPRDHWSSDGLDGNGNNCCSRHNKCKKGSDQFYARLGTATTDVECGSKITCQGGSVVDGYRVGSKNKLGAEGSCVQTCAAAADSAALACPTNMVVKAGANCMGEPCEAVDFAPAGGCCEAKQTCATGAAEGRGSCGIGFVNKTGALCTGASCSQEADYSVGGVCCEARATCGGVTTDGFCTAGFVYNSANNGSYCAGISCDSSNPEDHGRSGAIATGFSHGDYITLGRGGICPSCPPGKWSASGGADDESSCCSPYTVCTEAAGQYYSALSASTTEDRSCGLKASCLPAAASAAAAATPAGGLVLVGYKLGSEISVGAAGTCVQPCAAAQGNY
eukprot:g2029.t1